MEDVARQLLSQGDSLIPSLVCLQDVHDAAQLSAPLDHAARRLFARAETLGLCFVQGEGREHPHMCDQFHTLHASRCARPLSEVVMGMDLGNVQQVTVHWEDGGVTGACLQAVAGVCVGATHVEVNFSRGTHQQQQQPPGQQHQHQHQPDRQHHGPGAAVEALAPLMALLGGLQNTLMSLSFNGVDCVLAPSFLATLPALPGLEELGVINLLALPEAGALVRAFEGVPQLTVLSLDRLDPNPDASLDDPIHFGVVLVDCIHDSNLEITMLRVSNAWVPLADLFKDLESLGALEWRVEDGFGEGDDYHEWQPGEAPSNLTRLLMPGVQHRDLTPEGARAMVQMCPNLEHLLIEGIPIQLPTASHSVDLARNHTALIVGAFSRLLSLVELELGFLWPLNIESVDHVTAVVRVLGESLTKLANTVFLQRLRVWLQYSGGNAAYRRTAIAAAQGLTALLRKCPDLRLEVKVC